MQTDFEIFITLAVEIVLGFSWMFMFGLAIWLFFLCINLSRNMNDDVGLFAKIFPTYIWTDSNLNEAGKAQRATFIKVFCALAFFIVLSIVLLLVTSNLPTLKF